MGWFELCQNPIPTHFDQSDTLFPIYKVLINGRVDKVQKKILYGFKWKISIKLLLNQRIVKEMGD